ncbi:uncharacterized protein LOC106077171 isoform X1 [Biomphalaria glabrata]|uniref:Uncharacterized protein LOC106077171 isoform X1 n=1 Tax=Biomphalaria glabrata TaxID=6526 RepID=A0A9W3AQ52_BIOGL|nr:uncharacterized protein LOC106077171 isoform X1 [Biomphalaria glabrata]
MWKASVEMLLTTELEQTIEDAIIIKMDDKVENVSNQTPERNGGDVTANVAGVENADVNIKNKISHYDKDKLFEVKQNGTVPRIGSILLKSHYTKRSLLSIQDDNETLSENYLNNIKKTLNRQIIEKASEKYNGTIPNVNMEGSLLEVLYNHTADHENKMLEHLQNITNQLQYLKAKVIPSFNVLSLLSKYKDWRLLQQQISIMYERIDKREQIVKNLDQEMKKTQDLYTPADSTEFIQWPRGTFALLKSYSGCPTNPIKPQKWLEEYKRFHTESSSSLNLNSFSKNGHLALPINSTQGKDHFMTLHYCVKNTSTNEEPIWPKGSYCINRYDSCLVNFTEGRFTFDEEDTNHKSSSSFITSDSLSHNALYFCCRNDGDPRDPIPLPVFTPFFLYRFGGRCQSVLGMSYKEEFVYIDTENGNNGDTKQSPHADGTINNVNITLCYYEMQSS